MERHDLPGFGQEIKELEFDGFFDWLVGFNDVGVMWKAQPTYIITQVLHLAGGLITLLHALKSGSRYVHLWMAIFLYGLTIEMVSYYLPAIDNFWHSQTPIILLGRRLPFHILSVYNVFIYNASIAAKKLQLPAWSEPFAVGLLTVLIDIPYDIMALRFLHWTWHSTDPNIYDRHYYVPWNSYYFHATFAASLTIIFHGSRRLFTDSTDKWTASKSCLRETICTILTGLFTTPGGILMFLPIYHPLHDMHGIHSEVTFFLLLTIFLAIIWSGDRNSIKKPVNQKCIDYIIPAYLVVYYSLFLGMAAFGDPSKEVSIGLHEPVGPCDEKVEMVSSIGQTLYKTKYLCAENNREGYFGWHCLPDGKPPKHGANWYTTCGTPLENRAEYITVIVTICVAAFTVFLNIFFLNNKSSKAVDSKKISSSKTSQKIKRT